MIDRLLNPERLVIIRRVLRIPENQVTFESVPYWMALAIVAEITTEENVQSLRVLELEEV